MENQNDDEATKLLKALGKALGSLESLVEFFEDINGKKMSPRRKQTLSKMTGLTPITTIEENSWSFSFDFVDEVGDVFLVVSDTDETDWVGIRWTPEGVEVHNEHEGYMTKYIDTYHKTSPSIEADVDFNFSGSTVPFKAQTGLCLIKHDGQYHLLGTMKIDGVTLETRLVIGTSSTINRSPVLTSLLNRLEVQKQQQSRQIKKENTMATILNLTQHPNTEDQWEQGVNQLDVHTQHELNKLLNFEEAPSHEEIIARAEEISNIAKDYGASEVMIGGAPFLMSALETVLKNNGIKPLYSFSKRIVIEETREDGTIIKTSEFKHTGFIEV